MKVILNQDVKGQGKKGQLVEVSDGYARNFLLPRKLAVEANADNVNKMKLEEKAKKAREAAEKAEDTADISIIPSPRKLTLKSIPFPLVFTMIIPTNPNNVPNIFFAVSFSCPNTRQEIKMVINTAEPVIIEDFTPVVCASPI